MRYRRLGVLAMLGLTSGCLNSFELRDAGVADSAVSSACASAGPEVIEGFGSTVTGAAASAAECTVRDPADLAECVAMSDRHVVFDVPGGVLTLTERVGIVGRNLTLAGETQPGGLTIRLLPMSALAVAPTLDGGRNNVLVRHIRFEGDGPFQQINMNPMVRTFAVLLDGTTGPVDGVAVHHVTVSGTRLAMGMWGDVSNVTVQRCMIRNQLYGTALRDETSVGARRRISIHRNLFYFLSERIPQIWGDSREIEVVNNLVDDWVPSAEDSEFGLEVRAQNGASPRIDVVGNRYAARLGTPAAGVTVDDSAEVYFEDNVFPPEASLGGSQPAMRWVTDGAPVTPTADLAAEVLDDVGACATDAFDREAIANARATFGDR